MRISNKAIGIPAVLAAFVLAGCSSGAGPATSSSGSSQSPSGSSGESGSPAIVIDNFAFKGPASVAAGARISLTNLDNQDHSVTADDGSFDAVVHANGTATLTAPTKPGNYTYHCSFHPNMHGTLVVT
jgi:plastocyanin